MKKSVGLAVALLAALGIFLSAQQPQSPPSPVIRVTTRLVMVDVIATDKSGKPVTDLKREEFVIEEGGKKQKISIFGMQDPSAPAGAPALPVGIYSNRPEALGASGPITILLIDGLNSPFQNQAFARQKLIEYIKTQHKPGQRMAVLALGNGLYKLQGFTSDANLLRAALENWSPESVRETAATQGDKRVTSAIPETIGFRGRGAEQGRVQAILTAIGNFEQEQAALALDVRIRATLESLRAIGRMAAGMPGRKNLVWVSASFPITLTPEDASVTYTPTRINDPTAPPPIPEETSQFAYAQQVRQQEVENIRRTAALLADAQVAIYPVDARGLVGAALADASSSGLNPAGMLRMGHEYGTQVAAAGAAVTNIQGAMHDLAQQTGGQPYFNRNDIDAAVAVASRDGGTYYDIGYYPDKKKFDGTFRKLKVTVTRPNVEVRYRRGYYAVDPTKADAKQRDAEMNAMLFRDSGEATLVTFDVQVQPPAKNKVTVHFLVPARSFSTEEKSEGRRVNLDFFLAAVTPDGKVAANTGQTVDATLTPDQFAQVQQHGLVVPMEATLPAGEMELRLAVRDNRTGYFGTLNVPLSAR